MATDPAPTAPPPTFGALLQQFRLAAGLSQEALAERAGVSARAISDLERGRRLAPYPHTVRQLAKALRLGASDRDRLLAAVPPRRGPAPLAPAGARPTSNLPAPVSSFVGREPELAEVRRLLGETRLLTLTGAGGVGKTRLALAVAGAALGEHRDGVWLVELAALADPALVPPALANVLGVREQPGQALVETLVGACASRRMLLVLDNCEHLLDACARLADALLRACPHVQVLATSREALGSAGEVAWPAPPLALPDLERLPAPDELARVDAVRLFVERAAAALPSFALTAGNAAAVARLCVQLDGIPLALELAAARVKGLPPEELAARLDQRFRLLTAGSRTAPPRQQTLRATVDWSHALLDPAERALLRRLAVFAGGWTIEAAEAVGALDDLPADAVLDLLLRLVDKSLALADARDGRPRYQLLETVRQYAWEKLREAGEEGAARDRHAAHFLALAERAEPALRGPEQAAWLDHLDAEHDNLRAALAWLLDPGEAREVGGAAAEAGLRLAGAIWWFWYLRHWREGAAWLERALACGRGPATAARAKALCGASYIWADQLGDGARGQALVAESVALYRALGDARGLAYAQTKLADFTLNLESDEANGAALLADSLRTARALDDRWLIAHVLTMEACAADLQRPGAAAPARAAAEEALARFEAVGDALGVSLAQRMLARVALAEGEYERAQALMAAAVAIMQTNGDAGGVANVLRYLAVVALRRGDPAGAAARYREGLGLCLATGMRVWGCDYLAGLAAVALAVGRPARAARLLGAGETARRATGKVQWRDERQEYEATQAATRAALADEAYAAAWAEGQALSLDEATADALADEPEPTSVAT